MIGSVTWPPLYVQKRWPSDQANHIVAFLTSADIKVFGCTYLFTMLFLIGLTLFLHPGCFCLAYHYFLEV